MTVSDMMRQVGVRKEKAIQSANIIEQSFRNTILNDQQDDVLLTRSATVVEAQILEQLVRACGFNANELRKAQKIIQVCFKDFYFREKEFTLKLNRLPYDAWANRVEKTLEIYRQAGPQRWELERAAIAIQSAYRGYYTRKQQRDLVSFNAKATAIQAAFRGHVVRKQLAEERAVCMCFSFGIVCGIGILKYTLIPWFRSKTSRCTRVNSHEYRRNSIRASSMRLGSITKRTHKFSIALLKRLTSQTDNLHVDLCPRVTTDSNIAAKMIPRIEITEAETGKLVSPPELDEKLLTPRGWDENKAATKIQALYRGHKVRKYLEQMDDKIVVVEEPDD